MYLGVVLSPCNGTVEKVSIKKTERIYEWETLFLIREDDGSLNVVQTGLCGEIDSLEVQVGDKVIPGMVLAYVQEDLLASASE